MPQICVDFGHTSFVHLHNAARQQQRLISQAWAILLSNDLDPGIYGVVDAASFAESETWVRVHEPLLISISLRLSSEEHVPPALSGAIQDLLNSQLQVDTVSTCLQPSLRH